MIMTSSRPYIIRALYEWILENQCTPYVLVNAMAKNVEVPQQHVKNGQIVLNVSPTAAMDLKLTNQTMQFNGRFGGLAMDIFVPISAIMGIYTKENGQGMIFDLEEDSTPPEPNSLKTVVNKNPSSKEKLPSKNKSGLRVVK